MSRILLISIMFLLPSAAFCQIDSIVFGEPQTLDLQLLVAEAMMNNPEIQAAVHQMDVMEAKVPQAGALEDPELDFMAEDMPGFNFGEAMYLRFGIMQMFRFPAKLSTQSRLANIRAEHAQHGYLERVNGTVASLKMTYYELWLIQQNRVLVGENIRLMNQFVKIAGTRYATGQASQQDILKARVELAMLENELTGLRQQELSAKAMLMTILNRSPEDTLGFAVIPEEVSFSAPLDSLERLAMRTRPMLMHDSLAIDESRTELTLAKQEYIPDFKIGLQRSTSPVSGFAGWGVSASLSLPFAPWTLGKASARKEEAEASIMQMAATYTASRNMVASTVKDLYYKADAGRRQLGMFHTTILPQARQSLRVSQSTYQTGATDFLMLIDSYRTLVNLTKDYFMTRMKFEQTVAMLEQAVGSQTLPTLH